MHGTPPALGEFPLLRGPLLRLGRRLGLVRGASNSIPLGLVLGATLWLVLFGLAMLEGLGPKLFSLPVIGVHVRLLLAIPLYFVCETMVGTQMRAFVRVLARSEVVPPAEVGVLEALIARQARWRDSWLAEALCLLAAVLVSMYARQLDLMGTTSALDADRTGQTVWTVQWFAMGCLPVFRFLLLRWLWLLLLWAVFLWRVSRMNLHLVPTHPDGVGGLGYLETVHSQFASMVFALSAVQSASIAEEIVAGSLQFADIYPGLVFSLVTITLLHLAPMFVFGFKLRECRAKGLRDYMTLASNYVSDFESKWVAGGAASTESLLGTVDLQSLADLGNSLRVVQDMTLAPRSRRLLLLRYPLSELLARFLARASGF